MNNIIIVTLLKLGAYLNMNNFYIYIYIYSRAIEISIKRTFLLWRL